MDRIHEQLGKRIRVTRETKKMSQEELSARSRLSVNQIGRIERAERSPSLKSLMKICDGLEVQIQDLFKGISIRSKSIKNQELKAKIFALLEDQDETRLKLFLKIAMDINEAEA